MLLLATNHDPLTTGLIIDLCHHTKRNSAKCAAPALRGHNFCRHHQHHLHHRPGRRTTTPPPALAVSVSRLITRAYTDPSAIRAAINELLRSHISGELDAKSASLALYALNLASGAREFEPSRNDSVTAADANSFPHYYIAPGSLDSRI